MKKRIVSLLCAVMMAVSLAACTSEGPGKEASEPAADSGQAKTEEGKSAEDITLGVSFGQNVHPFFVAMQKGIEQACEDYSVKKCNILSADSSLETQNSQLENLVTMGCDAILLNPYDSEGVVNAVSDAVNGGTGVFTMDVDCDGSLAFVASDNKEIGKMLAEYVIEKLDGKGKIAIIPNLPQRQQNRRGKAHGDLQQTDNDRVLQRRQKARIPKQLLEVVHAHPGASKKAELHLIIAKRNLHAVHRNIVENDKINDSRQQHQIKHAVHPHDAHRPPPPRFVQRRSHRGRLFAHPFFIPFLAFCPLCLNCTG